MVNIDSVIFQSVLFALQTRNKTVGIPVGSGTATTDRARTTTLRYTFVVGMSMHSVDHQEDIPDFVDGFVLAGKFGFKRVEGPFSVRKDGVRWIITTGMGNDPILRTLDNDEDKACVILNDGVPIGGGIVENVIQSELEQERDVVVNQYMMGDPYEDTAEAPPINIEKIESEADS